MKFVVVEITSSSGVIPRAFPAVHFCPILRALLRTCLIVRDLVSGCEPIATRKFCSAFYTVFTTTDKKRGRSAHSNASNRGNHRQSPCSCVFVDLGLNILCFFLFRLRCVLFVAFLPRAMHEWQSFCLLKHLFDFLL